LVEVADRDVDAESAARPGQRDVEQPPFFLESVAAGERHVGGEVAVGGVDQVDGLPLEALGGVDGAEDEVVLVELRLAG
jgi:hypothetical protein